MTSKRMAIMASWLLIVAVISHTVLGFERTLKDGRLVLLELAPVDPRSLMQGDYMALRFALDAQLPDASHGTPAYAHLHVGAQGRAVLAGSGVQPTSEPGMVSMRIRRGKWGASIGPNAFFFQEGTAAIHEQARWGGFRVASDGTALLTGLYDEELQLLGSNQR